MGKVVAMAANPPPGARRKKGSNQYQEQYEAVDPAERRLPRKRREGMQTSSSKMATPGKPFQCPLCAEVHATGEVCSECRPRVSVEGTLLCPGCRSAMIPSGVAVCDECERLALVGATAGPSSGLTMGQQFSPGPPMAPPQWVPPAAPPVGRPVTPPMTPPVTPPVTPPAGRPVASPATGTTGRGRPMPRRNG